MYSQVIIFISLISLITLVLEQPAFAITDNSCLQEPTDHIKLSSSVDDPLAFISNLFDPIDPKTEAFHLVVIGDSIAWGEGLNQQEKYYYLVAQWLQSKLRRPVDVTVYAHNGATLKPSSDPHRCGECGSAAPSLFEQANMIVNPDKVDLILVSGGINDVNVIGNIIDSDKTEADIQHRTEGIKDPMRELLNNLLNDCKNAKIIVTGYYPVLTENTNDEIYYTQVYPKLHSFLTKRDPGDKEKYKAALIDNSRKFYSTSDECLKWAVDNAYDPFNSGRVVFAPVNFPPDKCFGAVTYKHYTVYGKNIDLWWHDNSWLWSFDRNWLKNNNGKEKVDYNSIATNDHTYQYRIDHCVNDGAKPDPQNIVIDKVSAIAHPNVDGAKQYRDAIKDAIDPTWLDSYKVESKSLWDHITNSIGNLWTNKPGSHGPIEVSAKENSYWRTNEYLDNTEATCNPGSVSAMCSSPNACVDCGGNCVPSGTDVGNGWICNEGKWSNTFVSRTNEMRNELQSSDSCDTAEAKSWLEKGSAAYKQSNYIEAAQCFDEAIKICPQYAEAWSDRSAAFNSLGKYDEGLQACNKAIELSPDLADAWTNKGWAFNGLGRYNDGLQAYDKSIELDSQSVYAWGGKGVVLINLGRYDEALQACEKAIELNSQYDSPWFNYGAALYYSGRYDEAVKAFDEATNINPECANAWQFKGLALEKCNHNTDAEAAFKKAAELGYHSMFNTRYWMF